MRRPLHLHLQLLLLLLPLLATLAAPSNSTPGFRFVSCQNRAAAYSGAWLAHRNLVSSVGFPDMDTLEWHSFNMYQAVKTNRGHALRTADERQFLVNHVSGYEHELERRAGAAKALASVDLMSQSAVQSYCAAGGAPPAEPELPAARKIAALIPYFGGGTTGEALNGTGNSHTKMGRDARLFALKANCCRTAHQLAALRVVVGVCSAEDERDVSMWLDDHPRLSVLRLECDEPVHLPFVLLRRVQKMMRRKGKAAVWGPDSISHVYFNEADQFTSVSSPQVLDWMLSTIDKAPSRLYIAPHRFSKKPGSVAGDPEAGLAPWGQNHCAKPAAFITAKVRGGPLVPL